MINGGGEYNYLHLNLNMQRCNQQKQLYLKQIIVKQIYSYKVSSLKKNGGGLCPLIEIN